MEVIRKLGDRVEKEHDQYLRDSQRIEDRSAISGANGTNGTSAGGTVDFESLVGGGRWRDVGGRLRPEGGRAGRALAEGRPRHDKAHPRSLAHQKHANGARARSATKYD